jgi:hypothetical protein
VIRYVPNGVILRQRRQVPSPSHWEPFPLGGLVFASIVAPWLPCQSSAAIPMCPPPLRFQTMMSPFSTLSSPRKIFLALMARGSATKALDQPVRILVWSHPDWVSQDETAEAQYGEPRGTPTARFQRSMIGERLGP